MKAALIQLLVTESKKDNVAHAAALIKEAADNGADIAILPEMFCCPYTTPSFRKNAEPAGELVWQAMSAAAAENNIWVIAGSMPEKDGDKCYNTSFVFDSEGKQVARHRKMHLFDVDIPGLGPVRESDTFTGGNEITVFDTPWGKLGLEICYDIRFPELARAMVLNGAEAMIVPAAFGIATGTAHWEYLFRARAVDNQVYTIGVSPARDESADYVCYGHSLVCSPWADKLCEAGTGEEILYQELDFARNTSVRQQLPLLQHRRTDIYTLKY